MARTEEVLDVIEEPVDIHLAVVEEADSRARERAERRRQTRRGRPGCDGRIEDGDRHTLLLQQVTQSPIARVTAGDFVTDQGGTTAPKPPAGPPAATTSRSSGAASAVYSRSSPRARRVFPTARHSLRRTRARRCTNSRTSRFCQPAATSRSRSCFGITRA